MTQVMIAAHRHVVLKRYLQPELKNFRKKTLMAICDILNLYLTSNNKKERQIECIIHKFCELLNNAKKNGIAEEVVIDTVLGRINHSEELFPQIIRKALMSYLDYFKVQGVQQSPQMLSQIKRPVGMTVEDIKETKSCVCRGEVLAPSTVVCSICLREYHKDCLHIPMNEVFECPFCFMRDMDPIHEVVEPLFIGYLRAEDNIHNFRFMVKEFDVANPRYQIEARCVRLDGKNNYELTWPDYGYVKLNESKLLDFKPLINNSSLKRRKDESKIVERRIIRANGENHVQLTVMPPQLKEQVRISIANHLLGFYIVKINNPNQVLAKLKQNVLTEYESRQILVEQMSPLDEITVERLDVSLECVFSMQPIKIPVRSRECRHFNCFDLAMMIATTTKSQPRRWRCPICKKKAHRLIVDPILSKIIQENEPKLLSEVSFLPDLSYKVTQEKIEQEEDSEPSRPQKPVGAIICLDDEQSEHPPKVEKINAVSQPPGLMLDQYQDNTMHDGLSFEPNPFMMQDLAGQMEVEDASKNDKEGNHCHAAGQDQEHHQPSESHSEGLKPQEPASIWQGLSKSNEQQSAPKRITNSDKINESARNVHQSEGVSQSIMPAEPENMQSLNHPPAFPQSDARATRLTHSMSGEQRMEPPNNVKRMPMPFEIITPNPVPSTSYSSMRSPHSYYMPPTASNVPMGLMPPQSRYSPSSKGSMYPPYPFSPYFNYFGMGTDMTPASLGRSRYDDPSLYMPRPPEFYSESLHMRQMPPLSHLQHLQQMTSMTSPYAAPYPPPPTVQNTPVRNYQQQPSPQPPSQQAYKMMISQQNRNFGPPKLSQSSVSSVPSKLLEKRPSVPGGGPITDKSSPAYYKSMQMRNIQQPASTIQPPTNAVPPRLQKHPSRMSSETTNAKLKQVIEILDSEEETEEQRNENKAKDQWAKLNQLNLQTLKTAIIASDKENSSLREILENYEQTQQPA